MNKKTVPNKRGRPKGKTHVVFTISIPVELREAIDRVGAKLRLDKLSTLGTRILSEGVKAIDSKKGGKS